MDLFRPEAKNPPNGPIMLAKTPIIAIWNDIIEASKGRKPKLVI